MPNAVATSKRRATLTVLMRPEVRAAVVEIAESENRSMARTVEVLLDEALAARARAAQKGA